MNLNESQLSQDCVGVEAVLPWYVEWEFRITKNCHTSKK